MAAFKVGNVSVEVSSGGHPVWISIKDDRGREVRFDHRDLFDLRYAVDKAIRAARDDLPISHKRELVE